MHRARETAELVAPVCGVVVDTDLLEWDYGVYEGETTPADRASECPAWSVWTHEIVGGESVDEVGARADRLHLDVPVETCRSATPPPSRTVTYWRS